MSELLKSGELRLLIGLSIILSVLMMTGCGSLRVTPKAIQESLLVKCPNDLAVPNGKKGKDWELQSKQWAEQYHECKLRHNGLVDVIKTR